MQAQAAAAAAVDTNLPRAAPMEERAYARLAELRDAVCVTDADLAAMGCDAAAAERVLTALRGWAEAHAAELDAADAAVRAKGAELRHTWQQIHIGPRNDALTARLPLLEQERQAARGARADLLEAAATAASVGLNPVQQQVWATARANTAMAEAAAESGGGTAPGGLPSRYRYVPGLTTTQLTALKKAMGRPDGGEALAAAENATLQGVQRQAMADAHASQVAASPAVLAGRQRVVVAPLTHAE